MERRVTEASEGTTDLPWLEPTPGGVGALASWTAADGRPRLASSGTDATIQIWDPEQGVPVAAPLVGHSATVLRLVAWTWNGGRLLASASEDGTVCVWDMDRNTPVSTPLTGHDGWVQTATFWNAPDGRPRLASAGQDGTVRIWDPLAGTALNRPLVTGSRRLAALASWATAEGTRLAVADDTGTIAVWDPDRRVAVGRQRMHHTGGLWTLTAWIDRTGAPRLASGGHDGTIRIWDPEAGREVLKPLRGHTNWVPTLATWTGRDGGARLASASTDGTVRIWDGDTGLPIGDPLLRGGGSIALPTISTWLAYDGRLRLTVAAEGGAIRSYDIDSGEAVGDPLIGHVAGMWALTNWRDVDGTRLARSGDDGMIRTWNADTGQTVGVPLSGHTAAVWGLVAWHDKFDDAWLASTGDDGTIRLWNITKGIRVHESLAGHAGWVPGLTVWSRPDGSTVLASAGIDGTIRQWDPVRRAEIGTPLRGHGGWILAVVAWEGRDGVRLASGGDDGTVRLWDPVAGVPIGEPLRGHNGWVRSLAVWRAGDRTVLASASYDGTIRIWDPDTGEALGQPLVGHTGRVGALTTYTAPGGGPRLASAGADGLVCLWDLDTLAPVGAKLSGHRAGVWALTSWDDPDAGVRIASAGQDGSVRLWDPETGHAVRIIEIGPVSMWGLSDAPMSTDLIGRQLLADAIADQLGRPPGGAGSLRGDGPTVVSIEGPWGCGKSTLMNLVRSRLPGPEPAEPAAKPGRHLTVRAALRQIRRYPGRPARAAPSGDAKTGTVTAWFNPWAYQSGEQLWAGLTSEIVEAAAAVLYPSEPARERYWFARNLSRVDRYALRRSLLRRTRSPVLGLAALALLAPFVLSFTRLETVHLGRFALSPFLLAGIVALIAVLAGVGHTVWQRWFGTAVTYLPSELFAGPVVDGAAIGANEPADAEADPLHRARSGTLYLHQHDLGDLVDDLGAAGFSLVVFVDDIDRCRPGTIAEVFEAINLFLSNVASRIGLRAQFVVGLDSTIVARHLDDTYGRHAEQTLTLYGDDPTPGWAFLRKLIQLSVLVPQVPDDGFQRLVDAVTQPEPHPEPAPVRPVAVTSAPVTAEPADPSPEPGRERPPTAPPPAPAKVPEQRSIGSTPAARTPVDTFAWRSAEEHPEIRDLLVRRLSAQLSRSVREAKRLINVWQFYQRIAEALDPFNRTEPVVRARRLLILAEIITRWPALQGRLHRYIDGRRGLQLLAVAAEHDSDEDWRRTVRRLGLDTPEEQPSLDNLRELLREHEGRAVAQLAARLL
jgi:WD40 repeat protein